MGENGKRTTKRKRVGYLHGFTAKERQRLHEQARVLEPWIYDRLPFSRCRELLEVGSGVGAQTSILLRLFPETRVTCVERSKTQVTEAKAHLPKVPWAKGRFTLVEEDATSLSFDRDTFDGAFICWLLEHVSDPARILGETRRVLKPGAPIIATEVLNATFFLEPYSPRTLDYYRAFNDHQIKLGGDPFVGAKLGNLLQAVGFSDIQTRVKVAHFDSRQPAERADFLKYWTELLLSGAPGLIAAKKVSTEHVEGMRRELETVARDPQSVFFYAFVQAEARA